MADTSNDPPNDTAMREVPIDWEALENAFENNAPEVHSYLQVVTGDVLRVVDGVADPQMHARIASDPRYLRIEAVSSREQYRWMERYIPTVEEPKLRARLEVAIDGKGAFRRFKDVLMAYGPERERWFTYRSERLRTFMEAWLQAHNIKPIPRSQWSAPPEAAEAIKPEDVRRASIGMTDPQEFRRGRSADNLRRRLRELADMLGPRDLDSVVSFAEFLKARRAARSFAHHTTHVSRTIEETDTSMETHDESSDESSETDESSEDSKE